MEATIEEHSVKELLSKQRKFSLALRTTTYRERKKKLKSIEKWILENREAIHEAVFEDFKKSSQEVDISEIFPVITEIRHTLKHLKYWMKPKQMATSLTFLGSFAEVQYEPKGTTLIIAPWNYPFNLTMGPLVSAIAAGNTAILKPSEFTPHTSGLIEEMIQELFDEKEVAVMQGDYKVSSELLKHPFDHIFFTGSPRVGKIIMEAASKHLTSVTLELGGKSPTIVDDTANLKDAAEKVAWGKWLNAGQTCVAPDYVFIHEKVKEEFLNHLKSFVSKIYADKKNFTGIINRAHFDRLNDWIADAVSKGAKVEFSGENDEDELKIFPIVLSEVAGDAMIMSEEIFGPILPVMTYSNLEEVLSYINERPKPLALYHFSGKRSAMNKVKNATSAGSMCINDCVLQFGHPDLPFGGVNNSGIGKAHGHFGFLEFSNQKSVLKQRTGLTMAKTLYPPFDSFKKRMLDLTLRYF